MQRPTLLRRYLILLSSLLFLQGTLVLLCLLFSVVLPSPWDRAIRPDALHGCIHILSAILIAIGLQRYQREIPTGLSFGLFYLLFALVGMTMVDPLGLLLDTGENLFHLLVGAIAVLFAIVQRRSRRPSAR